MNASLDKLQMGHRTAEGWIVDVQTPAQVRPVTLLFGTHQSIQSGQEEVTVRLSDRIILSPFAAKRLATLIAGVVGEYEKRFGPIVIERKQEPREVH